MTNYMNVEFYNNCRKYLDQQGPFDIVHLTEYRSFLALRISKWAIKNKIPFTIQPQGSMIMGGKNVTPKEDIVETPQDKQALENAKKQRSRFNFQMIDLQPGTILKFRKDETITCEVHDDTKIKFRDKITSLSNAAEIILKEMGYDWSAYQGPRWWMYEGKNLRDIRRESE